MKEQQEKREYPGVNLQCEKDRIVGADIREKMKTCSHCEYKVFSKGFFTIFN
jgi:hypothetical protein